MEYLENSNNIHLKPLDVIVTVEFKRLECELKK
jgi:hypothetical protein